MPVAHGHEPTCVRRAAKSTHAGDISGVCRDVGASAPNWVFGVSGGNLQEEVQRIGHERRHELRFREPAIQRVLGRRPIICHQRGQRLGGKWNEEEPLAAESDHEMRLTPFVNTLTV
jgi:hypothetical protein